MAHSRTDDAECIFEIHRPDVYRWAVRVLGSHHDAQDTVQDVFLRWFKQARGELPEHPRRWLKRTTLNRAIDLLRARKSPKRPFDRSGPDRRHEESARTDQLEALERDELRTDLAEKLGGLPEMQRTVLVAKEFEDLTFAQIASDLSLAVPTVKTHYIRALRSLEHSMRARWG